MLIACSGGSEDLTTSDTIPTNASVPTTYSGASRLFARADSDDLTGAVDGATDVTGNEQGLTFCAWFDLTTSTDDQHFVSKHIVSSGNRQYALKFDTGTGYMEALISGDGESAEKATGTSDVTSGWHHACGVHDPVNNLILVYVDGYEEDTTEHTTGIFEGGAQFRIGGNTNNYADALIDEVIVLDRVLTATEVLEIYTYGIDGSKGGND